MQVRKFEAKTMKDALELVKVHMGPEAIILSARDSHRGFGLMGEKSVEVTAAVSEETLRKKKIAESKLRDELRERFQQIPASKQREFINRVFTQREERETVMEASGGMSVNAPAPRPSSSLRYIDIADDVPAGQRQPNKDRVRSAAERARMASREIMTEPKRQAAQVVAPVQQPPIPNADVRALEAQLTELKALVERFQRMPQTSMSLHPGAEQGLPFELSPVYQKLTAQGVAPASVTQMLKKAQREMDSEALKKSALVEAWIVGQLLNSVQTVKTSTQGRYHIFMGSTGQGKTSTLVKFASRLVMKEKKTIAIISLDTQKLGAADQLRIYAQILNVPFAVVRTPEEWRVAESKLKNVAHILVDCPGFNLRSMEEADWLKRMLPPAELDRRLHYVQSVLAREEEALDLAGRYQMIGFHDVIFTRLDESSRFGMMLNFQERFQKPIHSFGVGSRVPEDFEYASKERVIDLLFKL